MSEEKEEALRQINDIKNHLVDKQIFFPYNYKATYVWAVIATILTFIMIPMYQASVLQGTIVTFVLITIGFLTEGFLTKKVNQSYDIEDCTHRQQFIMKSFLMLSLFGIVLSMVLAHHKLYIPVFLLWLFLCSVGYFSVGFVLNIERFSQMARFNIMSASLLLGIGYFIEALEGKNDYLMVVQFFVVLGLAIMPSIVAWQQIKEGK
ncbi:MAG TPA: hypothetical protein ENK98_09110 [Epsilonproteobacteria bacterium]|nr:hypothetical protein [Campylobacterota bacterium]